MTTASPRWRNRQTGTSPADFDNFAPLKIASFQLLDDGGAGLTDTTEHPTGSYEIRNSSSLDDSDWRNVAAIRASASLILTKLPPVVFESPR